MLERLCARSEPDQDIDIAVDAGLVPKHRPEQSQPFDSKQADLGFCRLEAANRLVSSQRWRVHAKNIGESG